MTTRPEAYEQFQDDRVFDALEAFEAAARERGVDMAALALAWLLADERVTSVIVGPRAAGAPRARSRRARARARPGRGGRAGGALRD